MNLLEKCGEKVVMVREKKEKGGGSPLPFQLEDEVPLRTLSPLVLRLGCGDRFGGFALRKVGLEGCKTGRKEGESRRRV